MVPKQLKSLEDFTATAAYDPKDVKEMLDFDTIITITIMPPPLFIMSPRIKLYAAKDIKVHTFKGHIGNFQPEVFDEEGEPVASLTITPTEEIK